MRTLSRGIRVRKQVVVGISCLAASVTLAACEASVEIGGDTISADDIEAEASSALGAKVGQTPKSVDCPDDLDAKEGESEQCTLTAKDGTTYEMTATIESVSDDGTAHFDFQVGNKTS